MHENMTILGITLVVLGYGYVSKFLARLNISGPMVFTAVGVLLSPLGIGRGKVAIDSELVQIVAEIALIIILFSDAASLDLKRLRESWRLPARLLFIGLPLCIVLSTAAARFFFPGEPESYLLLLALVLAPTDAALGKAVVSDRRVPARIRSVINVESGLNDGIVFPILITVVTLIVDGTTAGHGSGWLGYVARQIVFGAVVGAGSGYLGGRLASLVIRRRWMENSFENLVPIALAVFSYYLAEFVGGNGFISAFFSGLFLGNFNETLRTHVEDFAESEGELLALVCFLVFGLAFIPAVLPFWNFKVMFYSLLSLSLLRMVPVAVSLVGSGLDQWSKMFIGWFGPRGIASLLYVLIVVHQIGSIKGHEIIYAVIGLTICLSIFAHGISARPLAAVYGKFHTDNGDQTGRPAHFPGSRKN
ncbi:MAG TPA: sodium:proton antiporter [Desulfobulbus sp.]|nr:sodium:proton antiporter [Desulfobulbus sp.]